MKIISFMFGDMKNTHIKTLDHSLFILLLIVFDSHMSFHITQCGTAIIAILTFVWFLSSMFSDMISHVLTTSSMVLTKQTMELITIVWSQHMRTRSAMIYKSFHLSSHILITIRTRGKFWKIEASQNV